MTGKAFQRIAAAAIAAAVALASACSVAAPRPQAPSPAMAKMMRETEVQAPGAMAPTEADAAAGSEEYASVAENAFVDAASARLSTFSIDVDTASYSNARRFILDGSLPPADAVRVEEFINYFGYSHALPTGAAPYAITTELASCPWAPGRALLMIGLRSRPVSVDNLPAANLVFLVDVSGSMMYEDKLPLVKKAFGLLVENLRPRDTVAIVVYAGAAGVVLPPTPGDRYDDIMGTLDALEAGGSTAGGQGIQLAYRLAAENFKPGGTNRVILATDGDFNVGAAGPDQLEALIAEERGKGIFLTVLGFGTGNTKDATMERLADKGNGSYAYIDSVLEARRALVEGMGASLLTVAKDVKIQVDFDPAFVASYRLIGYENRMLEARDFADDAKDAGEMGAGHAVTALYELTPAPGVDIAKALPWAIVKSRYKPPAADQSVPLEAAVVASVKPFETASADLRLASAVSAWAMMLKGSRFKGSAGAPMVEGILRGLPGTDPTGRREELLSLVAAAAALGAK